MCLPNTHQLFSVCTYRRPGENGVSLSSLLPWCPQAALAPAINSLMKCVFYSGVNSCSVGLSEDVEAEKRQHTSVWHRTPTACVMQSLHVVLQQNNLWLDIRQALPVPSQVLLKASRQVVDAHPLILACHMGSLEAFWQLSALCLFKAVRRCCQSSAALGVGSL